MADPTVVDLRARLARHTVEAFRGKTFADKVVVRAPMVTLVPQNTRQTHARETPTWVV